MLIGSIQNSIFMKLLRNRSTRYWCINIQD